MHLVSAPLIRQVLLPTCLDVVDLLQAVDDNSDRSRRPNVNVPSASCLCLGHVPSKRAGRMSMSRVPPTPRQCPTHVPSTWPHVCSSQAMFHARCEQSVRVQIKEIAIRHDTAQICCCCVQAALVFPAPPRHCLEKLWDEQSFFGSSSCAFATQRFMISSSNQEGPCVPCTSGIR